MRYDGQAKVYFEVEDGSFLANGELMDECDVVLTNPPFSISHALIDMTLGKGKDLLILGTKLQLIKISVYTHLVNNKLFYRLDRVRKFVNNGEELKVTTGWFSTFFIPPRQYSPALKLCVSGWTDKGYPFVNSYRQVPEAWEGWLLVPITFIEFLDPSVYELHPVREAGSAHTVSSLCNSTEVGKRLFYRLVVKLRNDPTPPFKALRK